MSGGARPERGLGGGGKIRFRTCLRNTIYDALRNRPGWVETDSDSEFDFVWADVPWMRAHFDSLRLDENARVNHFRNHYELTRKDLMVKNLKRMRRQLEREDRASEAQQYDFYPETYMLPNDYNMFVEAFKRSPGITWIAKPVGKAQGRGIFLFNDIKDVKEWKRANDSRNPSNMKKDEDKDEVEIYVAQRYIENPYLVGGKKFDLRLYILVTSYMPLTIWQYRSGFARFSSTRFTMHKSGLGDIAMHLTNVAIQKTAPGYDRDAGCKWDLRAMKQLMLATHGLEQVNQLFHRMQLLMVRSCMSVQKVMMQDKRCFELYGFDLMIDDKLKPWLIEVNASPSLSADTAQDHALKVGMLQDMIDILDLEKKLTGSETQVGGFDLVYQNGPIKKDRPTAVPTFLGCHNDRKKAHRRAAQAQRARDAAAAAAAAAKK